MFPTDMITQALELSKKPHVVVATPGRLADHIRSSDTFSIKKIQFLVSLLEKKLIGVHKGNYVWGCLGEYVSLNQNSETIMNYLYIINYLVCWECFFPPLQADHTGRVRCKINVEICSRDI